MSQHLGYRGAHQRVSRSRGSAVSHACADCDRPAKDWSYVGGCPDEMVGTTGGHEAPYCPHPQHYVPRCKRCHAAYDPRAAGEQNGRATLTDAQVRGIRASLLVDQNGKRIPQAELARALGISKDIVGRIRRRENWRHI